MLQIFSPIPFILYHPDLVEDSKSYSKKEIKTKNGHFDKYYFDAISFYADDYMKGIKFCSESGYNYYYMNFSSDLLF